MATQRDAWDVVADGLEARTTRLVLAILIVLSLLPYPELEDVLRPVFLVTFGAEIVLRLAVLKKGKAKTPRAEKVFLLIDLLAFGSFLPLHHFFDTPRRFLRILRIARLLVLVRFTRELAGDVYRVLTRREQLQQLGLVTAAVLALSFVAAVLLWNLGIVHDYDGVHGARPEEGFWEHVWWAFRQVESPDNLIQNLQGNPFLIVVSLGLTITGIFVFSYLIGIGTNVVEQVLRAERRRPIAYRRHTLVMGNVHQAETLVGEFVAIYEKNRALRRLAPLRALRWVLRQGPRRRSLPRMALLGAPEDAPSYLYEAGMRWVVYRDGDGSDEPDLVRVAAADAKRLLILAEGEGEEADALSVARLSAFRAVNDDAHVFVEIRRSANAELARAVGGEGTFVLDKPRFVGQFLCHHLIVPGMQRLMSELLSARGREVYTHLFVDRGDTDAIGALGKGGVIDFEALATYAHQHFSVILLGVFLGTERTSRIPGDLVPVERTAPWVNPWCPAEPELEGMPLTPGEIPAQALRGIFGIAETYAPMRRLGRALRQGDLPDPDTARIDGEADGIASDLMARLDVEAARGPTKVLVVGRNPALAPLVDALARFVPGVTVRIVTAEPPKRFTTTAETALEQGGRCVLHRCEDSGSVASEAARIYDAEGADSVVFLSNPATPDGDAQIGLRVLQFVRDAQSTARAQLLVELVSGRSGAPLERQLLRLGAGRFVVTMVSTSQITNYFLVHSAFVPGLMGLYERLLGDRGQEIVRLPLRASEDRREVTMGVLQRALSRHRAVVIGVDSRDEGLVLAPEPDQRFALGDIQGLFAVADTEDIFAARRDEDV